MSYQGNPPRILVFSPTTIKGEDMNLEKENPKEKLRLSRFLRTKRLIQGLTKSMLGKRSGLSRVTIHNIEKEKVYPKINSLCRILKALECTLVDVNNDVDLTELSRMPATVRPKKKIEEEEDTEEEKLEERLKVFDKPPRPTADMMNQIF